MFLHMDLPLWAIIAIAIIVILGWKIIKFALKILFVILLILLLVAFAHIFLSFI